MALGMHPAIPLPPSKPERPQYRIDDLVIEDLLV
jgi:hypothetical protein